MRRSPLICVVLCVLLVAATPASAGSLGSLEARAVHLDTQSLSGELAGAEGAAPSSGGPPPALMRLEARALEVLVDHEAQNATVAMLAAPSEAWTTRHAFTDAAVDIITDRSDAYFLLAPAEGILSFSSRAPKASLAPGQGGELRERHHALNDREPVTADTGAAHSIRLDAPTSLEIRGNLVLALWDYDIGITADEGPWSVRSGEERRPIGVDPGVARGAEAVELRQVVLRAEDARLRLDIIRPGDTSLHAVSTKAAATTAWFDDASGSLVGASGRVPIDGTVRVEGGLTVTVAGSGSTLRADIDGDNAVAHLPDAQTVALQPRGKSVPWGLVAPLAAGGLLAAVVVAVPTTYRFVEAAAERGDHATVARFARPLSLLRYRRPDVLVHLCLALSSLDRPDEARRATARFSDSVEDLIIRQYLLAHIEACQERWEPAQEHLDVCLELAPWLETQIRSNPVFATFFPELSDSEGATYT